MVRKQEIIDYYDQCEIDYRLVWGLKKGMAMHYGYWDETTWTFRQALNRTNEIVAQRLKLRKNDRVLDAGCGVGGSAIYLAKKYGCQVVGITLTQNQVKTANQNAKKHDVERLVQFLNKDYSKTGFKKESFDVIIAIESIVQACDKKAFLQEAYRLLKKGGRIAVIDYFQSDKTLSSREQELLHKLAKAWIASSFLREGLFQTQMKVVGFRNIRLTDETEHILPLALRLYVAFFPGYVVAKALELFKKRTAIQKANLWSAYWQYPIYKNRLLKYCIVTAEK